MKVTLSDQIDDGVYVIESDDFDNAFSIEDDGEIVVFRKDDAPKLIDAIRKVAGIESKLYAERDWVKGLQARITALELDLKLHTNRVEALETATDAREFNANPETSLRDVLRTGLDTNDYGFVLSSLIARGIDVG